MAKFEKNNNKKQYSSVLVLRIYVYYLKKTKKYSISINYQPNNKKSI